MNGNFKRPSMAKKTIILIAFIIAKFVIQYLLIDPAYDLHRDEYLHLDQANHLASGYLSVPPLTSWISYIISLLGNGVFWVKFFPALFGALTIVVVWKAIEELKGSLFALILGATAVLLSVLLRINLLYQPNSLDILLWTTFYFIILKFIHTENPKWFYYAAVVFAAGMLNKYNFVFVLLGFFPAIVITAHRKIFANKHLYYAASLGCLLILPNLIWQYNNHFPVFHHLDELARTQLVNVKRSDFLKEQVLFFIGSVFIIISALLALFFYKPYKKYRVFSWAFIFTILIYVYLKAKGYYAIGLYPFLIAVGAVFLGNKFATGWKKYLMPIAIAIPVLISIPIFNIGFPNKSPQEIESHAERYKKMGLLRWEDGKDHSLPQDFADMLGWKELAAKVDTIYSRLPNKTQTLILCDNYGQAGAINYYSNNKNVSAVSFNADYINWFNLENKIDNVIRVKEFKDRDTELNETSPYFDTALVADSITNSFAREFRTTIFVFEKAKIDISERLRKEIADVKNHH